MRQVVRVYVSGPLTTGDVGENIHVIIEWAEKIWEAGFVPYVPHLAMLWHMIRPHSYDEWINYDLQWLPTCDCVFRTPGESPGADGREIPRAVQLGMPVFYNLQQMKAYYAEDE